MPWSASAGIRSAAGGDAVDRPVERRGVDATAGVLAERREARDPQARRALGGRTARPQPRRLDPSAAEVAEHVAPVERRDRTVADDDAAGDGAVAAAVEALDDRAHVAGSGLAGRVAAAALERAPAEILAAAAAHEVDLLDRVLADIADREVPGAAVEGEPPRIAQPVAVDLGAGAGAAHERVRARD